MSVHFGVYRDTLHELQARVLELLGVNRDVAGKSPADVAAAQRAQHQALEERLKVLSSRHESFVLSFLRRFPPQSRLLAVSKGARVCLLPVSPQVADEFAHFAPTRDTLRQWSTDAAMRWEIGVRQGAFDEADPLDWPAGFADSISALIRFEGAADDATVWDHVVTSDAVADRPSGLPLGFRPERAAPDIRRHRLMIVLGARDPALVPFLHALESDGEPAPIFPPFGEDPVPYASSTIPRPRPEPRKRSVLFVNPAYYNFKYLAQALRARGWDAMSMAIVDPQSDYARHFHGHDWNLFVPDANQQLTVLREKFKEAINRFDMFHFHGRGTMSFFTYNYDTTESYDRVPWDVLEMKRRGALIAYTSVGTPDLDLRTSFEAWSPTSCPRCSWRDRPDICSDYRSSSWRWKVQRLADLICMEGDAPLDLMDTPALFREPLSFAVDSDFWNPELARTVPVPDQWKEPREPNEILIYHSVGNYDVRTVGGVNMKGTGPILAAIERLKAEGFPVRLLFRTDVPSIENRWMIAQADIVVDQLNYGRFGATAREGLMLGRPVVGRLNKLEPGGIPPVRAIAECPIVDASEDTIFEVLKGLVQNPEQLKQLGRQSRDYAVKWWSKEVLAERYERVHDHLRAYGRPPRTLDATA